MQKETLFTGKVKILLPKCRSTQDEAKRLSQISQLSEGTLVYTFTQTEGRGQYGKQWVSEPEKNFTGTYLLNPRHLGLKEQFILMQAITLGLLETIKEYIPSALPKIKWPNDVLINGRKVSGILIENNFKGNIWEAAFVGIGVNINQSEFSEEIFGTSLCIELGNEVNLQEFVSVLNKNLEVYYLMSKTISGKEKISAQYAETLFGINEWRMFKIAGQENVFQAQVIGVNNNGNLELEGSDGKLEIFSAGELIWILA